MEKEKIIMDIILKKRIEYAKKYDEYPKFIKMPRFLLEDIKEIMQRIVTFKVNLLEEPVTIFGMMICDTLSINDIDEIEVF